jgi:heptosyltransferase-1
LRVLIVKVSALGDVVHALPVLSYLKSVDPRMEIDWVVENGFVSLLEGHPHIRKVYRIDTKLWRKYWLVQNGYQSGRKVMQELRAERYDVVLDLQGNSKSGLITFLSGAPLRYGFAAQEVREWPNLLATNRRVGLGAADHHITDRSLRVAASAFPGGMIPETAGPIYPAQKAVEWVADQFRRLGIASHRKVVFHYGTSWSTKLWTLGNWQELARRVAEELGATILLTWAGDQEQRACRCIKAAAGERAILWPPADLQTLAALLARVDLAVGGDTGPIHIAAAMDTPTVSIYRVTDCRRNGPRGPQHRCLQSHVNCSPCLRKSCPHDASCSASISVQEVFQAIGEGLGSETRMVSDRSA